MTYIVVISSGEVLETEDPEQYCQWLDDHGPEVVDTHEPSPAPQELKDAFQAQYMKPNPRQNVGSIYPSLRKG